ncbi:hypothetical protein RB195_003057 [Necator americanus]
MVRFTIVMRLLLIAPLGTVLVSACWSETICNVTSKNDIMKEPYCKWLRLDVPPEIPLYPNFYNFIKKIPGYDYVSVRHTNLVKLTELKTIKLKNGSTVIIMDNMLLKELPEFEWKENSIVRFYISNNPKLDTTALRTKIEEHPIDDTSYVQRPFACGSKRESSCNCRVIEDNFVIGLEKNEDVDKIEEIYGSLKIENTELEELPKMPKLRKVVQLERHGFPAIIIKDNPNLKNIEALFDVEEVSNVDMQNVVIIKNNSKLCVKPEHEDIPFVLKYGDDIERCG